jgi:hypothetical protein
MAPKKKWSANVTTESTYPEEGLFNQDAATIAKHLASKKVSPKRTGLRHEDAELLHQSRRQEPLRHAPCRARKSKEHPLRYHCKQEKQAKKGRKEVHSEESNEEIVKENSFEVDPQKTTSKIVASCEG